MNPISSLHRTLLTRWLFHTAILTAPFAFFAVAACGGVATTGGGTGGGGGGGQGGSGGGDGSCSMDKPCSQGACVFPAGSCQQGAMGTCQDFFQCDGPDTGPVCGCDGMTVEAAYGDCVVGQAGEPYDLPVGCQVGTFSCGPTLQCKRNGEVCVEKLPGVPGPTSYECAAFEAVTMSGWCLNGIPDCACIDTGSFGAGASTTCAADADHQETVTVALP
jgi:hypothetical protein